MIKFDRFTLKNGLRILVHEDRSTPLVSMNLLYDVGSRDEDPARTGFAHLFEHLMFGGSVNVPDYDAPLQMVGAENNAFTSNDITNYYITVPADNIETGFWLESDRMLELNFDQKNLETQKHVVIEEYKQRYLNQPYGDSILILRPMVYKVHPYNWPTIGRNLLHIENAKMADVKDFFFSHYAPNNAIMCLAGNITTKRAKELSEKWFGNLPVRNIPQRNIIQEPEQKHERRAVIEKDVPVDALYKVWHTCPRLHDDFYALDLLTDLLAGGESGRLYVELVREKKLFSEINAYITSDIDPGILILQGSVMEGVNIETAEKAVNEVIGEMRKIADISEEEMEKVKNKYESSAVFTNTSALNKAVNLCFYELLGNADLINSETAFYRRVTPAMVHNAANRYLVSSNCSTLYYKSLKK